jgi:hypothetical protein
VPGSILSLFGNSYDHQLGLEDSQAIANDWTAIGNDLRSAIALERERETERKNNVIHINFLSETDRGRWVIYRRTGSLHSERGRIKDWTDQLIYVVYQCADQWDRFEEYTSAATDPEDLEFA